MGQLVWHNQPVIANESPSGGPDSLLAVCSEGDICDAGMLPTQGPLRFAVTGDEDAWGGHDKTIRMQMPCDRVRIKAVKKL